MDDNFGKWLELATDLAEKSIKNYLGALRKINLDLHAKGIDNKLINLALKATENVTVSPKYIAEHMALPYHQTSIRKQEMPPKDKVCLLYTSPSPRD